VTAGVSSERHSRRTLTKGARIIGQQTSFQYVRERLSQRRILWIGGSPCAGKSTLARHLAEQYGLAPYRCDEALDSHLGRITAAAHPTIHKLTNISWNELWTRPIEVQIREELAFYREDFPLIVEDLLSLPVTTPLIVEGTALLPELIAPLLAAPHQAVWLVPTATFQRDHYARRSWIEEILRQCADPAQAFDNWMRRDSGFADIVEAQAIEHALWVQRVDGTVNIEAMTALVAAQLGL
jgi:2-phosphoglycerate kinase